ncbi:TetR/AcrR family transcriptional regulator [Paenibacillus flagellatus]|uniref:TetR/AcrR family transcriptional regulator n=1 Tax=Paenibacillus flagellatus TaxID=2211139 RepID=A0A2V5JVR0_9BACL|nr:TetR/AcrR family transcriptional regulator [Paenibacillus flagellatus]PYI50708.1 TetR/AcrR family transcriptional regulator [Paenibacillus flagellatus]
MSPRTKEQNEEIRKERMRQLLRAAVLVYAEKGYAASEIGEIAERAGLARGLVYHYFKDKRTLFRELYEHMMEGSRQFTRSHFEREGPAFERFVEYAEKVCRQVLEDPATARFYMRIALDVQYLYDPGTFSPFEWMKSFIRPMTEAVEAGMRDGTIRGGDASLLAMQFWGAVSQGMNYLGQLQREMLANGTSEAEALERLEVVLGQVVESAVAVIRPE